MDELAGPVPALTMSVDRSLAAEFESRLQDSCMLAFRVAYGVLRQREDAEDVAQEALARAYRSFAGLRDRERFRGWLVRTAWRLALDRRRTDQRRLRREQAARDQFPVASVEDLAASREFQQHLWRAVDGLPEKLRLVIVLAGIEGYEVREVARLLAVPEGTVKSRLFLARNVLAEKLRWLVSATKRS